MTSTSQEIAVRKIFLADNPSSSNATAILAEPYEASRAGVVLLHDWWGLTDTFHNLARYYANCGYTTIAPDLYDGAKPKYPLEAMRLLQNMDFAQVIRNYITPAKAHLPESTAVIGFSLGGGLALLSAAHDASFQAAISFYGLPKDGDAELSALTQAIQVHVCEKDEFFSQKRTAAFLANFDKYQPHFECHRYTEPHGFCNSDRPDVFDEKAAKTSLTRSVDFIESHCSNLISP